MSRGWRDWKPGLEKRPNFEAVDAALPSPNARGSTRSTGMNKTEASYAQHLQLLQRAGEITWFAYEAMKLRLADRTFYTPDYLVLCNDGSLQVHEVKGRKGARYWCHEDAKIKIKVAAQLFPMKFRIVWPLAAGAWGVEIL